MFKQLFLLCVIVSIGNYGSAGFISSADKEKKKSAAQNVATLSFKINTNNNHMIELNVGDSLDYDGLTLVYKDGGHKILMDEHGKRSGDLSFVDVLLQEKAVKAVTVRFFHPGGGQKKPVEYGNYVITAKDMGWNGAFVLLDIKRKE